MTLKVKKKKVTKFVLNFSAVLASASGQYQVTQAGKGKKSARKHVGVTSMKLGAEGPP